MRDVGSALPQQSRRDALQAVHQNRNRNFGRIPNQQVHMIILADAGLELDAEVRTHVTEDVRQALDRRVIQNSAPIFCNKDQMHMKGIDYRSSSAKLACANHGPSLSLGMLLRKAQVFRLYPTTEQSAVLGRWVGAVRFTYNVALEQRRDWYRPGRSFNFASQCREITTLRAEVDWLRDVPVHALHQGIKDLDRAYQNWWAGRAEAPTPRKRGFNDAMRFPDPATFDFRRLSRRVGEVRLPKLGWVKLHWDRGIRGEVKNITVVRRAGVWTVAAQYEIEVPTPEPSPLPAIGIDRGVTVFAALSDGTAIAPVNAGKTALRTLARAQRNLARKRKGSQNRIKARNRVTRIHARVARIRKDFLHKVSTNIAKNHGAVVLEKLEVRNMVRSAKGTIQKPGRRVRAKSGLNRSILDQGWGGLRIMLNYKLAERGGTLIEVPAAYTSQTCSACGIVDAQSRISQSRFACIGCGHAANADTNAAINILRRADSPVQPVEASRKRAREAGTTRRAA